MTDSPPSSTASAGPLVFELGRSPRLLGLCAALHLALAAAVAWRWSGAAPWSWLTIALIAAVSLWLSARYRLRPGRGTMPCRIRVSTDGEWRLEGARVEHGYLQAALVTPWLCQVTLSRVGGGRRTLWLARDAMDADAHWRLRRLLRARQGW